MNVAVTMTTYEGHEQRSFVKRILDGIGIAMAFNRALVSIIVQHSLF